MMDTLTLVRDQGRLLIQDVRRRRLGSLFVPIRRSYLLVMPAMLFAAGILGFALRNNFTMIFDAFVVSAVSIYITYDVIGRASALRASTVLALTLGLGYGLGTLNTWYTLPRGGKTLGEFLNVSTGDLAEAMAGILIAIGLMLALGEALEKPFFGEEFRIDFSNRAITIASVGALFRLVTVAAGKASGLTAQNLGQSGHVGAIATISGDLEPPLLALSFCMALNASSRWKRYYLYGLTAVLFLLAFPNGRRAMIYGMLLLMIATRLGRFRISLSPFKKIAIVAIVGGILYFFTLAFYYFRVASYNLVNPTFGERVGAVVDLVETSGSAKADKQFTSNVEGRTFILAFVAQLVGYTNSLPGAHGQDLLSQFGAAVPSALDPGKDVSFTEEGLANLQFGAHFPDQANSIFTAGVVDFGLLGLLAYPLLIILICRVFIEVTSEVLPVFPACFVALMVLGALLEPELNLGAYFIAMREGILVGGAIWVLYAMPRLQLTKGTTI